MNKHMWVKMSYVPIEVALDVDEAQGLVVEVTESAQEIAEEEALLGCWHCYTPLSVESFNTECIPD